MLAVATGLPRAASSTAYQLLIAVLDHAGHDQSVWRSRTLAGLEAADGLKISRTGFLPTEFETAILPALKASGLERWCAVKTNGGLGSVPINGIPNLIGS